jgi:tRNA nucleotidyltransferase/poly(A) polymerase
MNTGLKKKTIKSILKKRVGDWIRSLPEDLQERAKRDTIVTGGCIASMLLGEKINDIDIYFTTQSTTKAIAVAASMSPSTSRR